LLFVLTFFVPGGGKADAAAGWKKKAGELAP